MSREVTLPVAAGIAVGVALVVMFAVANPVDSPKPVLNNLTKITAIITPVEAEEASRDHLDKIAQSNGEEEGAIRGGSLGSLELIYVHKNGTNFEIDKYGGTLGEKLPYALDNSHPDRYYWVVTLNYGNSAKPEYVFTVNAHSSEVLQVAVID